MTFDIFFSICQTEVDGYMPNEKQMWQNFFSQLMLADELGFGTAWIAETHLSCQIQKRNPGAVIPHFTGEIGLNTDILQLAHKIFAQTKNLNVGSAIRNILCNGGPIAHAEAIRTFLSLHGLDPQEKRQLNIGFASGRFPFSNVPYGIRPRNETEKRAWPALRGLIFQEATEIFLRLLRGDILASHQVRRKILRPDMFRTPADWENVLVAARGEASSGPFSGNSNVNSTGANVFPSASPRVLGENEIEIAPWWVFDQVGVIPFEAPLHLLRLTIGAHDAASQNLANEFMPVDVFNLSITPSSTIEETHMRMLKKFHPAGGTWTRENMPRTVLVFIDEGPGPAESQRQRAREYAEKALSNYWRAIEGTLDPERIRNAVDNALVGSKNDILEQMQSRFSSDDRLMLWFDFNNHDTKDVETRMRWFMERVAPFAKGMA